MHSPSLEFSTHVRCHFSLIYNLLFMCQISNAHCPRRRCPRMRDATSGFGCIAPGRRYPLHHLLPVTWLYMWFSHHGILPLPERRNNVWLVIGGLSCSATLTRYNHLFLIITETLFIGTPIKYHDLPFADRPLRKPVSRLAIYAWGIPTAAPHTIRRLFAWLFRVQLVYYAHIYYLYFML